MHDSVFCDDTCYLVALGIEFFPEHIFQVIESETCDTGDEYHRKVLWKGLPEHLHQFFIEEVALCHSEHAVLLQHIRIKLFQLIEQEFILLLDVVSISRHHKEEQGVALDVSEEA